MKKYPQFISTLVSLLCQLHHGRGQEEMKMDDGDHGSSKENCLGRGLPGRPGLHGPVGQPGRDGRDCMNTLSMSRLFDLEKRVGQLDQKCQFMEIERERMAENIEAYRVQNQNILRFLAAKKIIDPDLVEILGLDLPLTDTSAETFSTEIKSVTKPFESKENPTTEIPTTEVPMSGILTTEAPTTSIPTTEAPTTRIPTTEAPTTRIPTRYSVQKPTGKTSPEVKTSYSSTSGKVKTPRQFYLVVFKSQILMKSAEATPSVTKPTVSDTDIDDESVTKPTVSDTDIDNTKKSAKKNCQKRFHVQQKVATRGAVDMEVFEVDNNTFLAVANFHIIGTSDGYNAKSFVYKMNPTSDEFELFQELPTIGCRAMVAFTTRGESYLVAANHYDGTTYDLHSVIYKWNGTQFENFRKVRTSGASAAQFFTLAGESYLMFANYRNDTTVSVSSVIYKWRPGGNLELFQNLQTHGAVDSQVYESQYGTFLVFANYYTPQTMYNVESTVYKWNGTRFVFLQNILTSAAVSVDMFEEKALLFLAIASNRKDSSWHSHSMILRWNGRSFQSFQQITTTAAVKVNHFFDPQGALFLTIANYFDEITDFEAHSMVYKFDGRRRFVKFQGILTIGAYDLQPFTYKGVPYLASAFRFNGVNNNIDSKIYKMTTSCETNDDLLP